MSERAVVGWMVALLVLIAASLGWAVAGPDHRSCRWAVTVGTEQHGYVEVRCGSEPPTRLIPPG